MAYYYVDFPGCHTTIRGLENAKLIADVKAREYGYARVCPATKDGYKTVLYEAGKSDGLAGGDEWKWLTRER